MIVCNYYLAGIYLGQFSANVFPFKQEEEEDNEEENDSDTSSNKEEMIKTQVQVMNLKIKEIIKKIKKM